MRVIGPTPLRPLTMPSQAVSTALPSGETMPSPVTTTLRLDKLTPLGKANGRYSGRRPPWRWSGRSSGLAATLVDVVDRLLDGGDLLSVFVRDLGLEFLFERHHEFNS